MIVSSYRSTFSNRRLLIALFLAAAYSPAATSQQAVVVSPETKVALPEIADVLPQIKVASHETKNKADLRCTPSDPAVPCPSAAGATDHPTEIPATQHRQVAYLPDAPQPQYQGDPSAASSQLQDKNSAVLFLPVKTAQLPSFADKFTIYVHQTFGPPAVIVPAFTAGMALANPKSHYPREWKDGAGAFGRNYGDALAIVGSQRTARFLTGVALHEDPRYVRSASKNPLARTAHALAFTFIDRTDSGRSTIAFSNFAGAAAGGFVGSAYLPHGYNDLTHAEQRMAAQFASIAIQNIAAEFQPQWGPLVRKLRINKILPEWWVPHHEK
jgi:hypothetical protein